jgi:hypothetical protein
MKALFISLYLEKEGNKKLLSKKERKVQTRKKRSESMRGRRFKKKKGDNG